MAASTLKEESKPQIEGRIFLAPVPDHEAGTWFVQVVRDEHLPKQVRRAKPKQILSHHACWIVGRQKFAWIEKSNLKELFPINRHNFIRQHDSGHFASLYDLISSLDETKDLEYFEPQIQEDAAKIDQSDDIVVGRKRKQTPKFNDYEAAKRHQREMNRVDNAFMLRDSADSELPSEDSFREEMVHNADSLAVGDAPLRNVSGLREKALSRTNSLDSVQIKQEDEHISKYAKDLDRDKQVHVYVGRHNKKVIAKLEDVKKSAVLASYICEHETGGAYIMRPEMISVNEQHFDAVLEFLHTGEYTPMLIENPEGMGQPKALVGLSTFEEYSDELVRAGFLYVLAQNFQIKSMTDQICTKVTGAEFCKYSLSSLIKFAGIIFNDNRSSCLLLKDEMDPLECWTIRKLSSKLQDIMCQEPRAFLQLEKVTRKRQLRAEIMLESAQQYRLHGCLSSDTIETL